MAPRRPPPRATPGSSDTSLVASLGPVYVVATPVLALFLSSFVTAQFVQIFRILAMQVTKTGGSKVWKRYVKPLAKRVLQILESVLGKASELQVCFRATSATRNAILFAHTLGLEQVSTTHVFLVALMIIVLIASERIVRKLVEVKEELTEVQKELKSDRKSD
eukprot:scaffold2989_cov387-Prasinococcus_capsulatus_cf.AAC.10